jgi:release factor glutamine methyltransferase
MTIHNIRLQSGSLLPHSSSSSLDIDVILAHILEKDRTYLLAHGEDELSGTQQTKFNNAIEKRQTGFPVAYITGHKEFYGYDFAVTPSVLIPKPDTELLVEITVNKIIEKIDARGDVVLTVCDMCTGSGCAGLSILLSLSNDYHIPANKMPKFTLADISDEALSIARRNADILITSYALRERVRFIRSNLFETIGGTFDVIVTNPPYVPEKETAALLQDGRSEPALALDGDVNEDGSRSWSKDGLAIIRRLLPQSYTMLSPKGNLFMETGEYNAEQAAGIAVRCGFQNIHIERDMSGQLRDVCAEK